MQVSSLAFNPTPTSGGVISGSNFGTQLQAMIQALSTGMYGTARPAGILANSPFLKGPRSSGGKTYIDYVWWDGSVETVMWSYNVTDKCLVAALGSSVRTQCTQSLILYVRTDGSDSNDGLLNSASGAFRTPQAAHDALYKYDVRNYIVTIQIGEGTYPALSINYPVPYMVSYGNRITINGAGDNTYIETVDISCNATVNSIRCKWIRGQLGFIRLLGVHFDNSAGDKDLVALKGERRGYIYATDIKFSGTYTHFVYVYDAFVAANATTITFAGNATTPNAGVAVAVGDVILQDTTYIGAFTGRRYNLYWGGSGMGLDALPGTIVGMISSSSKSAIVVPDHTHPAPEITGTAKVWGSIASTGVIKGSQGVASIARSTTGTYTVTFASPAPNANYVVGINSALYSNAYLSGGSITSKTTTGFVVQIYYVQSTSTRIADLDFDFTVHW